MLQEVHGSMMDREENQYNLSATQGLIRVNISDRYESVTKDRA